MVVVKVVVFFLPPVTAVKVRCLGKMNIEYTEMFGKLCAWRGSSVQLPGLRGYIGPVVYCHRVSPALKKLPRWVEAWFNKPQISVVCHSGVIYKQKTNNCLCRKRSRQAGSPYTSTLAGASQWNVIHHVRHRSQGWDTMNNPAGLCLYSLYLSSPPSLYFPFTHFLSVSTRSFSPWVVSALTAVLTPFVLVVRSRSAAFTITADLGAIKMVNSEQRLDMRDGERHPRRCLWRGSEKMSARERERERGNRGGVRGCDLGNGFCFQERLGFEAEHFTTDCTALSSLSLPDSCRYGGSRSVNTSAHRSRSWLWIMKFPLCSPPSSATVGTCGSGSSITLCDREQSACTDTDADRQVHIYSCSSTVAACCPLMADKHGMRVSPTQCLKGSWRHTCYLRWLTAISAYLSVFCLAVVLQPARTPPYSLALFFSPGTLLQTNT